MVDFILEKEFINPPDVVHAGKGSKMSTENVRIYDLCDHSGKCFFLSALCQF